MTWSWTQARAASRRLRRSAHFAEVKATVRPRSGVGLVRSRAPLTIFLRVAAMDGLIVEQAGGGFAVLQRPAGDISGFGGYQQRLLRWLDRRWDFVVFAGPPVLLLLLAIITAVPPSTRYVALAAALAAMLWISVFLTGMLIFQMRWVVGMGARDTPRRSRVAESLPAYHWSVPLLHQPDPGLIDDLVERLRARLTELIWSDIQLSAKDRAWVPAPHVTETLVVLTRGVSTPEARQALGDSLRAISAFPAAAGVVVIESPHRLETLPGRPVVGGGFLSLYLLGVAVALVACSLFVASAEAQACAPASCEGRPATFTSALRWLLQRLLLSDPPGLAPATSAAAALGFLFSLTSVVGVLVAVVAGRQEIQRNLEVRAEHKRVLEGIAARVRVLILVVSEVEREALLGAARRVTGRDAVTDSTGERVVYTLGVLAGNEMLLAQSAEQGVGSAAAMLVTAQATIQRCRPDYVILTGICYGIRPDETQRIGDIVVARRVHNVDHRKVTERDGNTVTIPRGVNVGCSPIPLDRFQSAQTTWRKARIHIGTVLSSATLMDSAEMVQRLREEYPDAIAGEMEGIGVYEATTTGLKPDWIMVKSISDWGHDKTDEHQALAAGNAADLVVHVLTQSWFPRAEKR